MKHPENPNLLAGIIADPEDDARRLVYADWLEENGDPNRGEFIRLQCRLADCSPAEADYPDLIERRREILAALWVTRLPEPIVPDSIGFHDNWHEERDDSLAGYHRGFPYFAQTPHTESDTPAEEQAERFRDGLPQMIETTTLRGLQFRDRFSIHLGEILKSPAARHLSALSVDNYVASSETPINLVKTIVHSKAAPNLTWLGLIPLTAPEDLDTLSGAQNLSRLRRLDIWGLDGTATRVRQLMASERFQQLRRIHFNLSPESSGPAIEGLARLPDLHTLSLRTVAASGVLTLGRSNGFESLGGLIVHASQVGGDGAAALAQARMPRLSSLSLDSCRLRNDDLTALTQSEVFANLRILSLDRNEIGDKGIVALSRCPASTSLRSLSLGDNKFGKLGLSTFTTPGAFPNLTTLDLSSSVKRKASTDDTTRFLTQLRLPRLRHLFLGGWPIDDSGAKAIANNPTFGNLTILGLNYCQIGSEGGKSLFNSPHLKNLVWLGLSFNPMGDSVEALLDGALPKLCECQLPDGISEGLKARLKKSERPCFIG